MKEMIRVKRGNMEVAAVGNMMIGRSKGPIKAILAKDEERIQAILEANREVVVEDVKVEVVEETTVVDLYEDVDIDDYNNFCNWMIANGGTPSIEEYRQAIEYYSSLEDSNCI